MVIVSFGGRLSESTTIAEYRQSFVATQSWFSFLGPTFRIYGDDGELQFFVKQKAFKLREEIRVFRDEAKRDQRLTIKARTISDFSGTYDILDATTGEVLGAARRRGVVSLFRDEWQLLDTSDQVVGKVEETGGVLLLLRKFIKLIPKGYRISLENQRVGQVDQVFNPFRLRFRCQITSSALDPRLGVGLVLLLLAIEGRRN